MPYKYIIDSSAWIHYFNGSESGMKVKTIIEKENIATSILAIAELADKYAREDINFSTRLEFIHNNAAVLPLTINISLNAAKIKKKFRQTRKKFGLVDAIHLATTLDEKSILVTSDSDFSEIENTLLL